MRLKSCCYRMSAPTFTVKNVVCPLFPVDRASESTRINGDKMNKEHRAIQTVRSLERWKCGLSPVNSHRASGRGFGRAEHPSHH